MITFENSQVKEFLTEDLVRKDKRIAAAVHMTKFVESKYAKNGVTKVSATINVSDTQLTLGGILSSYKRISKTLKENPDLKNNFLLGVMLIGPDFNKCVFNKLNDYANGTVEYNPVGDEFTQEELEKYRAAYTHGVPNNWFPGTDISKSNVIVIAEVAITDRGDGDINKASVATTITVHGVDKVNIDEVIRERVLKEFDLKG